jgi:hypothetical protein
MQRTKEQWQLLKNIDQEAYNLAVEVDEVERNGGDPRIVDGSKTKQPAIPAPPASGLSESQRDEVQVMITTSVNAGLKNLASATASVTAKVLKEKFKEYKSQLQELRDQLTATRSAISNLQRGRGGNDAAIQ